MESVDIVNTSGGSTGKIMHLTVLGRSIVVLSTSDAIDELLDKRSSIYSDRPCMPMAGELCVTIFCGQ